MDKTYPLNPIQVWDFYCCKMDKTFPLKHWFGQFIPVVSRRRKTRFLSEISSYYTKECKNCVNWQTCPHITQRCAMQRKTHITNHLLINYTREMFLFSSVSQKALSKKNIDLHVLHQDVQNLTFVLANGRASEENSPFFSSCRKPFMLKLGFKRVSQYDSESNCFLPICKH